ncbi:MAG: L-rhamnose mutarotase [Chitinophagaceae bacterium]|nr:L-rhamnose mutarotase [Chitinophagaceae bacterium]MDP1810418.1 L-rhamnose mutarotase [Sediminibacterium sp.]MDP3129051.1 L-rhamnose mutarotase [Sediminibacterium sp.]
MHKYYLALDLVDDQALIASYEKWHKEVWPEIIESITSSGIEQVEIYRVGNRLLMVMEVKEGFSFEAKSEADAVNPKVQEWEKLMWHFQQALPFAKPGEKWLLMNKIFDMKNDFL